jgi:hypothetical protein
MLAWRVRRRARTDPRGVLRQPRPLERAGWELGRGALGAHGRRLGAANSLQARPAMHQRAGAWSPPHEMVSGRNRRRSRTATPGRVSVCHRWLDPCRPKPETTSPRQRPDGCPFATAGPTLSAEAGRDRACGNARTGVRLPMRVDHPWPKPEEAASRGNAQTGARSPLHARPTSAEAEEDFARSDFRTVPGHHCTRDPRRPRPKRTLHAATSGRCPRSRSTSSRSVWIDVATRWVVPTELALAQLRPKPPPRARSHSRHGSEPLISPRSKRLECVAYSPVESHLPSCGHEDA